MPASTAPPPRSPQAQARVRRTQVGIIGAGPAGLVLSHLLARDGIASVIVEDRSREYVEQRVRAGVLEQGTVDLLRELGLADRMLREGLVHHGIVIAFGGRRHRIPLSDLTGGKAITIYGQQEVVKDLIAARLAGVTTAGGARNPDLEGAPIEFEVSAVMPTGFESGHPSIRYQKDGAAHELACDFIAGCDGSHGVSRAAIPPGILQIHERTYPFAWLGILAAVAPSTDEVLYTRHPRGFALHSLRSPEVSRLYLQVPPDTRLEDWPDARIWDELRQRLAIVEDGDGDDASGWSLREGPVIEKSIAVHRSTVVEPMQHGRLFLAGDAAHIVPPTGAKGLNLAVADVRALAQGIAHYYGSGGRDTSVLDEYSARCLRRVWRVQQFSSWMTWMLHNLPGTDPEDTLFNNRLAEAELAWLTRSQSAARSLAENYVGLPFD